MKTLKQHQKDYQLNEEEMEILKAYESGKLKPIKNSKKEIERMRAIARNTLEKTKNINLRITQRGIILLKRKAAERGLPYQTLAASVLYQYGTDKLTEKN
ncbi:MAG TPA: antitoxin [Candidatus Paceibacterota bacterium]